MFIEKLGQGPWADMGTSGSIVTIDAVEYDLDAMQQDSSRTVEIRNGSDFLAHIVVPPAVSETIYEGILDENGESVPSIVVRPVEMERVKIVLWTKTETPKIEE